MPGLRELLDRDCAGLGFSRPALKALGAAVGDASCDAVGRSLSGRTIVAVAGDQLFAAHARAPVAEYPLATLHSVVIFAGDGYESVLCPLRERQLFDGVILDCKSAERVATTIRSRLAVDHPRGQEWWDDPEGELAMTVPDSLLIVKPTESDLPLKINYRLTLVNTGIQFRSVSTKGFDPRVRDFVPWPTVTSLVAEGADQVQLRPRVGAVVAFGVLGLAARKEERRSWIAVGTGDGDYVLENRGMIARELGGLLAPVTRHFSSAAQTTDQAIDDDPIETIRRLGELRDAGLVTSEEFEIKKAELLKRL
jgi:hypothetical protein